MLQPNIHVCVSEVEDFIHEFASGGILRKTTVNSSNLVDFLKKSK